MIRRRASTGAVTLSAGVRTGCGSRWARKDWLIKLNGMRIDTGEIEAALRACPDVSDAAVLGRAPDGEVTSLVAFVVLRRQPGGGQEPADADNAARLISDRLRAVLPD